jgi:hypothetical protein
VVAVRFNSVAPHRPGKPSAFLGLALRRVLP